MKFLKILVGLAVLGAVAFAIDHKFIRSPVHEAVYKVIHRYTNVLQLRAEIEQAVRDWKHQRWLDNKAEIARVDPAQIRDLLITERAMQDRLWNMDYGARMCLEPPHWCASEAQLQRLARERACIAGLEQPQIGPGVNPESLTSAWTTYFEARKGCRTAMSPESASVRRPLP